MCRAELSHDLADPTKPSGRGPPVGLPHQKSQKTRRLSWTRRVGLRLPAFPLAEWMGQWVARVTTNERMDDTRRRRRPALATRVIGSRQPMGVQNRHGAGNLPQRKKDSNATPSCPLQVGELGGERGGKRGQGRGGRGGRGGNRVGGKGWGILRLQDLGRLRGDWQTDSGFRCTDVCARRPSRGLGAPRSTERMCMAGEGGGGWAARAVTNLAP